MGKEKYSDINCTYLIHLFEHDVLNSNVNTYQLWNSFFAIFIACFDKFVVLFSNAF